MAVIKEDYVSYEVAKLLKEKGFEGECFAAYNGNGKLYDFDKEIDDNIPYWSDAPTLWATMKWLREVHNICIVVTSSMFWGKYNVSIYKKGNDYPFGFDGDSFIPSYEQACEAAIKYCLENFI